MPKFKDAELKVTLGGHRVTIKGDIEIDGEDFQVRDDAGELLAENVGTVAGALIVEDRSNAKLLEQLVHNETIEVEGELVEVVVSYNGLDASRIETPVAEVAPAPVVAEPTGLAADPATE
jgi:hypothetical protein